MAYYKVLIEVWCDWDPEASALEEIVENISAGDAICTKRHVVDVVDRPQDIEDDAAMSFFGGEEGDADLSQGRSKAEGSLPYGCASPGVLVSQIRSDKQAAGQAGVDAMMASRSGFVLPFSRVLVPHQARNV